jgi:hypothetical protein
MRCGKSTLSDERVRKLIKDAYDEVRVVLDKLVSHIKFRNKEFSPGGWRALGYSMINPVFFVKGLWLMDSSKGTNLNRGDVIVCKVKVCLFVRFIFDIVGTLSRAL